MYIYIYVYTGRAPGSWRPGAPAPPAPVQGRPWESLGYFPVGFDRDVLAETTLEPKGEVLVFESLFAAGLRLPCHGFLVDVLDKYKVHIHQLTPNAMVALSLSGPLLHLVKDRRSRSSRNTIALHWQKRGTGGLVDRFRSCTFTLKTGKMKDKVVELVTCAKNKWGLDGELVLCVLLSWRRVA